MREVAINCNFSSQNPTEAHFGLADATMVNLKVIWPDGMETLLYRSPVDQFQTIKHPSLNSSH